MSELEQEGQEEEDTGQGGGNQDPGSGDGGWEETESSPHQGEQGQSDDVA